MDGVVCGSSSVVVICWNLGFVDGVWQVGRSCSVPWVVGWFKSICNGMGETVLFECPG